MMLELWDELDIYDYFRLFEHPLMKDGKLEERQLWWQTYLSGLFQFITWFLEGEICLSRLYRKIFFSDWIINVSFRR